MAIQYNNLLPIWLTILLALGLLFAVINGTVMLSRKKIAPNLIIILFCLRFAILLTFLLILLQPVIPYKSSSNQLPELLVLLDTSTSMNPEISNPKDLSNLTSLLQKSKLIPYLKNRFNLNWFSMAESARPIQEVDLSELKETKTGAQFAESIETAASFLQATRNPPHRILLLSKGNDHGTIDPVEVAKKLGTPIDVLFLDELIPDGVQQETPSNEVRISEVQAAARVLIGSDTVFRVVLSSKSPEIKDRTLHLTVSEDKKTILEQPIIFKGGRVEQTVEFSAKPNSVGLKNYLFQLNSDNPSSSKPYPLLVQVLDNKFEVLILEDRWRWDYKYLHRLFEDDPSFRFSALLNRGAGAFVQFGSPDRRVNLIGFPQGRSDLEGFDIVFLGDVQVSKWPKNLASDLARLISEDGRSLVVVAGPNLANFMEIPELHTLLPVELISDSGKPIEGPIEVRMRPDSADSPFFAQLRSENAEVLSPLDQIYPVLRKRPGATILLEAAKERNPYGNRIIIAEHTVGRGRVLFIATDTLWKWHTLATTNQGPTPYSIFWQQAFRAITPTRSTSDSVNLWLSPNLTRVETGRPVVLHAEVQSLRLLPLTSVQALVTAKDGKPLPLVFNSDPANPKLFRAEFSPNQPGVHTISATISANNKVLANATTTIQVVEPSDSNGSDRMNLVRIANATGGVVIDPAVPESWPKSTENAVHRVDRLMMFDMWNNFTLLLLLCLFLGIDWFIRIFKA